MIWVVLALVCAIAVLVIAGRVTRGGSSEESMWRSWWDDLGYALRPVGLRLRIFFATIGLARSAGSNPAQLREQLDAIHRERRRDRDIAKLASMGRSDESNSTLSEFLRATATNEPAYMDAEGLSDRLEGLYESVSSHRGS